MIKDDCIMFKAQAIFEVLEPGWVSKGAKAVRYKVKPEWEAEYEREDSKRDL